MLRKVIVLLFALTVSAKNDKPKKQHPIRKDIVDKIKKSTHDWTPYEVDENPLGNLDTDSLYALAGTILEENSTVEAETEGHRHLQSITIPESFDARKKWPKCVHAILSQGKCAGCWAFGSTSTFTDRFCIASGGLSTTPVLSY